jgi:hypothetical protein
MGQRLHRGKVQEVLVTGLPALMHFELAGIRLERAPLLDAHRDEERVDSPLMG